MIVFGRFRPLSQLISHVAFKRIYKVKHFGVHHSVHRFNIYNNVSRRIVNAIKLVTSEIYRILKVLKKKELQTAIAMITENKVIELFYMADDFCTFFDAIMT